LEHLLLRFGLLSLDQLNAALREQNATGTPFTDVLVREGIVSAADLERVLGDRPALVEDTAPEPEPEVAPEPEPELAVEPEPEPAPAAPPTVSYEPPLPQAPPVFVVRGRLINGEDVEIAAVEDASEAQQIALDAMRACARAEGSDWPVLNGRYVRPQSIVSIEVAERG
jgi:hypothetical protein